jgi:hypothetical protein
MDAPFARVSMPSDVDLTTSGTRIKVSWSGDDTGSGIVRYQLHQSTNGGTSWSGVWLPADDTIMIVRRFDPGTYLFRVRGIDAAGNISAWSVSDPLTFSVHDDNDAAMTYTGSWTSDANITTPKGVAVPVYGGSVMTSSTAGDTMTFAVNGSGVSFVTVTGRDRGIVEIIVDGRVAGARTVDLYRTATKGGKILLNIQFARPGDHVVTVRVTGTKHAKSLSPRVDIDGFVVTH